MSDIRTRFQRPFDISTFLSDTMHICARNKEEKEINPRLRSLFTHHTSAYREAAITSNDKFSIRYTTLATLPSPLVVKPCTNEAILTSIVSHLGQVNMQYPFSTHLPDLLDKLLSHESNPIGLFQPLVDADYGSYLAKKDTKCSYSSSPLISKHQALHLEYTTTLACAFIKHLQDQRLSSSYVKKSLSIIAKGLVDLAKKEAIELDIFYFHIMALSTLSLSAFFSSIKKPLAELEPHLQATALQAMLTSYNASSAALEHAVMWTNNNLSAKEQKEFWFSEAKNCNSFYHNSHLNTFGGNTNTAFKALIRDIKHYNSTASLKRLKSVFDNSDRITIFDVVDTIESIHPNALNFYALFDLPSLSTTEPEIYLWLTQEIVNLLPIENVRSSNIDHRLFTSNFPTFEFLFRKSYLTEQVLLESRNNLMASHSVKALMLVSEKVSYTVETKEDKDRLLSVIDTKENKDFLKALAPVFKSYYQSLHQQGFLSTFSKMQLKERELLEQILPELDIFNIDELVAEVNGKQQLKNCLYFCNMSAVDYLATNPTDKKKTWALELMLT